MTTVPSSDTRPAGIGPLSEAEIAAYRRDGFLVPRFTLPAPLLEKLQALTISIPALAIGISATEWEKAIARS